MQTPRSSLACAEAEETGWHGVFVWDHLRWQEPVVDVADTQITLAAIASATERIRLGPMVTPLARPTAIDTEQRCGGAVPVLLLRWMQE